MSAELEKGLVGLLSGVAGVHPVLPQPPVFPAIRYQRIYTTRQYSVDGSLAGVVEVGMQVDCIAETYEAAKATADAVRAILSGYTGAWGTLTARFVSLESENDFNQQDGDDVTHWVTQRYRVWTNMD